jgi:hypothetical protein
LIPIICAECGETFEIGEEFAGLTEYCPACGALNDIPDPEGEPAEELPAEIPVADVPAAVILPGGVPGPIFTEAPPRHGISSQLWWTIFITGIGLFVLACVFLFSSNWEDRNIQALSDATNRGDVLMADADYAGAARQYQFVLDKVDHRSIDSAFILQLVDHARRGEAEADHREHSPPTTVPQTEPSPATQPEMGFHLALRAFQAEYEAFPIFIRSHPVVFMDSKGNWRRRQYFVWQTTYDVPTDSESPVIQLRYDCASYITEPHHGRAEAANDDNFADDESPKIVHCQTRFELEGGRWIIVNHESEPETDTAPSVNIRASLGDYYPLEARAFGLARR